MVNKGDELADFSYEATNDGARLPVRVAIFGDDAELRAQIAADIGWSGFRSIDGGTVAALLEAPLALLSDVVVVDCPVIDSHELDETMLAGLDRVARSGAKLIVTTNMDGLDPVFAVMDLSAPQILISPSRAERMIAVGRMMGESGAGCLREMGDEERVALLRLSQQVEAIAHSLDRLEHSNANATRFAPPAATGPSALNDFKRDFRDPEPVKTFGAGKPTQAEAGTVVPDPRMVRQVIANRQARGRFFDAALFGDPAWDMLLDLTAAHGEGVQVSVTSLCIAADVPATTALRWLTQMVETGIFVRVPDPVDKRRALVALSEKAISAMAGYFASLGAPITMTA